MNSREVCYLWQNLGVVALRLGRYEEAEGHFVQGLSLARASQYNEIVITLQLNRCALAIYREEYEQAAEFLRDAITLTLQSSSSIRTILQNAKGQKDLIPVCNQVIAFLRDQVGDSSEFSETIISLVTTLGVLAWKDREISDICNTLMEELNKVAQESQALNQLLLIFPRIQEICTNPHNLLQTGLELAEQIGHQEIKSVLHLNLAVIAINERQYRQAKKELRKGLRLAERIGHRWLESAILIEFGHLHLKKQRRGSARGNFRKAREIANQIGAQELQGYALFGLAEVASAQGDSHLAQQQREASRAILRRIGHNGAALMIE